MRRTNPCGLFCVTCDCGRYNTNCNHGKILNRTTGTPKVLQEVLLIAAYALTIAIDRKQDNL